MKLSLMISALFAVVFTITGPILQFFPLFLSQSGLSESQISVSMSFLALSKIISTFFIAFFIDLSKKPHYFLAFAAGFTALIWAVIYVFNLNSDMLVVLTLIYALFWSSTVPLAEGFSIRACRLDPKINYGSMRIFGSISFILSGFLCGTLIERFGITLFPPYMIIGCCLIVACALMMPNLYTMERIKKLDLPATNFDVIKSLLGNKNFLFIVFGAGIMHAGHAMLFQAAAIDWSKAGYSNSYISLFFAIGVIAEIILFKYSSFMEKNFTAAGFFIVAGLASVIRWLGMAQNPTFIMIICLQLLHAFTFGALHLGCIRYFRNNLADGTLSAAQLIYGGVMWGVVMIPASFIAGYYHQHYGIQGYYAMTLLSALGVFILFNANNLFESKQKLFYKLKVNNN